MQYILMISSQALICYTEKNVLKLHLKDSMIILYCVLSGFEGRK